MTKMKYEEYKKNMKEFEYAIERMDNALTELHNAGYSFDHGHTYSGSDIPTMMSVMIRAQIAYMDVILDGAKKAKEYYEEHMREICEDYPEEE